MNRLNAIHSFIHSFILNIYIAPLQENYSEARNIGMKMSIHRHRRWRKVNERKR